MESDFPSRPAKKDFRVEQGERLLRRGRQQFQRARAAPDPSKSETLARASLETLYMAFNWLEDTTREDGAHDILHEVGRWTRLHFPLGCTIPWTGSQYERRCPLQLCHIRVGFSPGMIVGKKLCGLCGVDVSACPHLSSREYLVPGGRGPLDRCRVCLSETCRHSPDRRYWTRPGALVTEIVEILEVSMVTRPVNPAARLIGRPVDGTRLQAHLGPTFRYGVDTVDCSQCLVGCEGFTRFPGDSRLDDHLSNAVAGRADNDER